MGEDVVLLNHVDRCRAIDVRCSNVLLINRTVV